MVVLSEEGYTDRRSKSALGIQQNTIRLLVDASFSSPQCVNVTVNDHPVGIGYLINPGFRKSS